MKKIFLPLLITAVSALPLTAQQTVINESVKAALAGTLEHQSDSKNAPAVYLTTDISPEGLMSIYRALAGQHRETLQSNFIQVKGTTVITLNLILSGNWSILLTVLSWNVIPHTAGQEQVQPCICRLQGITAIPLLQM